MTDSLHLEINKKDLEKLTKKFNALSAKDKSGILFKAFIDSGVILSNRLKRNSGGEILKRRTGFLANSIGSKVEEKDNEISATIGSGVLTGERMLYANVHENGGTIRPVNKKYLAIPTQYAKTSSGVAKGNPRSFQNTFIAKNTIFQKLTNGKIIPLFWLKKSVTIPAKNYMSKTVTQCNEQVISTFINTLNKAVSV